jgi:hypothetical protein
LQDPRLAKGKKSRSQEPRSQGAKEPRSQGAKEPRSQGARSHGVSLGTGEIPGVKYVFGVGFTVRRAKIGAPESTHQQ